MVDEKEIAFWLLKHGWVETAQQGLRFARSAAAEECTEEMMDALSMKVLLEKGFDATAWSDLTQGLPEVRSEEVMNLLKGALDEAKRMVEYWHDHPSDTNAKFFRINLKRVEWEEDE